MNPKQHIHVAPGHEVPSAKVDGVDEHAPRPVMTQPLNTRDPFAGADPRTRHDPGDVLPHSKATPIAVVNAAFPNDSPKDARAKARRLFYEHLDVADKILRSPKTTNALKLRALDLLGKYGIGVATVQLDKEGNAVSLPPINIITQVNGAAAEVKQIHITPVQT